MTCKEILKIKKEVEEKINENKKLFIQALKKINKTLKELLIENFKINIYIDNNNYGYYVFKSNLDGKIYISKEYYNWENQNYHTVDEISLDKIIETLEKGKNIDTTIDFEVMEELVYKFEDILKKIKKEYEIYKEELIIYKNILINLIGKLN